MDGCARELKTLRDDHQKYLQSSKSKPFLSVETFPLSHEHKEPKRLSCQVTFFRPIITPRGNFGVIITPAGDKIERLQWIKNEIRVLSVNPEKMKKEALSHLDGLEGSPSESVNIESLKRQLNSWLSGEGESVSLELLINIY